MKDFWLKLRQSSFYIKWTNWEYYPIYIANIPTVFFWLYFGIRSRSLFFFSAVNPVIETGGVMGESKINILNRLPPETIPKTVFIKKEERDIDLVQSKIRDSAIQFPLIAKPNIGERGFLVEKLDDQQALKDYLQKVNVDFMIQEFVDLPTEVSVLYYKMPGAQQGTITSVCIKKILSVSGDGFSSIEQLMQDYPRARFQLERFRKRYPELLMFVPAKGEVVELEPIGNHSRGTTFLNGNHYIDHQLTAVFDLLAKNMQGIHYGRFDMKCESMDLLKKGKAFKILEFNGIASEPAHIYDPAYSAWHAYRDIFQHWKIIYHIGKAQRQKGIQPMSWKEAYRSLREYFRYIRLANQ